MGGAQAKMLGERSKVRYILSDAPLPGRSPALAVTSPVIGEDTEAACECRDDPGPVVMIYPGSVDEHERITRSD